MAEPFVIRTEEDVVEAVRRVQNGDLQRPEDVQFNNYRFEIVIRGEDFDGGVPTRIMPGLLRIQKAIDKGYSELVYGEERRLSQAERKTTELIVRVEPGSTRFAVDLTEFFNTVLKDSVANMDGHQTLIAVLGVAFFATTGLVLKTMVNARTAQREIDYKSELSQQETERLRIMTGVAQQHPVVAAQIEHQEEAQAELVKRLETGDSIVTDNEIILTGEIAEQIARKLPSPVEPTEYRMSGIVRIVSVESGDIKNGVWAVIRNIETGEQMKVAIPDGSLAEQQVKRIQEAEWGKKDISMDVLVRRKGKRFLSASLISVAGQE